MCGWIKIHRDLKDHWCSSDPNFLAVWMHLLTSANFKDKKILINGNPVLIKRGQLVFGLNAWSEKTGVSVMKLRRIISIMQDEGMINRQKTNKYSIISIVKWEDYQSDNKQITSKQQSDNNLITTLEEGKEGKERKEGNNPLNPPRGNRAHQWPKDFIPSREKAEAYWQEKDRTDLRYDAVANDFENYCKANGKKYMDWDRAWQQWYTRQVEFKRKPKADSNDDNLLEHVRNW